MEQNNTTPPAVAPHEETHRAIRATSGLVRFILEWAATVAELVIVATIIVIVASDVSGGTLIRDVPFLGDVYAWGQAFGIEGQMVAMAVLARRAFQAGQRFQGVFLSFLVLILGGVTLIGVGLANYQGTFHVSLDAALAAIGVGKSAYVWGRAVVLTVTGVAGAFLLHMPKQVLTAAQVQAEREQKRLRAELDAEDAALAAARRRRMVAGWKDTAAAFGPAAAVQVEAVPEVAPALAMEAAKEAPAAPTPLIPEPLAAAIRRGRAPHVSTSADALAATQA